MIGIIADFPVRDTPVITLTFPGSNSTILGANFSDFGQMINFKS
jgi:hypothetical protein